MSYLNLMLERNKDFAAAAVGCGRADAIASAGAAECKGNHHRLR